MSDEYVVAVKFDSAAQLDEYLAYRLEMGEEGLSASEWLAVQHHVRKTPCESRRGCGNTADFAIEVETEDPYGRKGTELVALCQACA